MSTAASLLMKCIKRGLKVNDNMCKAELNNALKLDDWYQMFKLYPEVFPDAYFRFLKANLEESLNKGTYIYEKGVLLTWKQYKKSTDVAAVNDFVLEKMISKSPGNGQAQRVMDKFLDKVQGEVCYLKVVKSNVRAICFYKKNGFKEVKSIKFGSIPGVLMKRKKKTK